MGAGAPTPTRTRSISCGSWSRSRPSASLLDDVCPYLETRELVEGAERRLATWTLKAKSFCGRHDARRLIKAWHDSVWTTQNAEHPFAYITTAFRNAGLLAAEIGRLIESHRSQAQ